MTQMNLNKMVINNKIDWYNNGGDCNDLEMW